MNTSHSYFITGIGTEVGKTVVACLFTQLLKAAYWKPIQSGDLDNSDSQQIQNLAEQVSEIIPERYL